MNRMVEPPHDTQNQQVAAWNGKFSESSVNIRMLDSVISSFAVHMSQKSYTDNGRALDK